MESDVGCVGKKKSYNGWKGWRQKEQPVGYFNNNLGEKQGRLGPGGQQWRSCESLDRVY